jgi:hypothetical protein
MAAKPSNFEQIIIRLKALRKGSTLVPFTWKELRDEGRR